MESWDSKMSIHVEFAGNRICYRNNKPKRVAKQDFAPAEEREVFGSIRSSGESRLDG